MPPIPPQIYCELLLLLKTATADRRRGRKDVTGDSKCFHGAEHVNPSASAPFWNHITGEFEVILTVRLKPWAFLVLTMLPSCQVCGAHMDDRWEDLIPNVIKLFHSRLSPGMEKARFSSKPGFLSKTHFCSLVETLVTMLQNVSLVCREMSYIKQDIFRYWDAFSQVSAEELTQRCTLTI